MARKDANAAVLGMLSTSGSQYRPRPDAPSAPEAAPAPEQAPATAPTDPQRDESNDRGRRARRAAGGATTTTETARAPRTIRLSQQMADRLRDAWLAAKKDDVLLTLQDFADDILDQGLDADGRRTP